MKGAFEIAGKPIGPGRPVYVIAEMSANHGGDFQRARAIVEAAAAAGADAVKLQTYTADTLTIDSDHPDFRIGAGSPWAGRTLYDLYGEAQTPWDWQPRLAEIAKDLGLACFSTPFDETAVAFLEGMDVPAHKIASFELVDPALVRAVARTGKPLILSTGMATLAEIAEAVDAAEQEGATEIALLKCTSSYPAPASEMNLRAIPKLAGAFGVPVGLSDHTLGIETAVAAVALGAAIVEKHLTTSRDLPGPDSAFSAEPAEFARMVESIRRVEAALGEARFGPTEHERASLVFRRSLYAVVDIAAGEILTPSNVRSIRPGYGLSPRELPDVLGRRAKTRISRGTALSRDLID